MTIASFGRAFMTCSAATAILIGCNGSHLIGGANDDASVPPDGFTSPADIIKGEGPPSLAAPQIWTGYFENFMFRSGSDAVRLAFTADLSGQIVGTVTLGNGTPPPPASDPSTGYPADLIQSGPPILGPISYIAEGYAYTMLGGTLTGQRLKFGVGLWELWTGWCALQTPAPAQGMCDEPVCSTLCLPNWGFAWEQGTCSQTNPATKEKVSVDCGKLALCIESMMCACHPTTGSCEVRDGGQQIIFDVTIGSDPSRASGSVTGQLGDRNVHFTKN